MTIGVFEFSQAFDTVLHHRLLKKLPHYNITDPIPSLIEFLCNCHVGYSIEGILSATKEVNAGVPKDTIIGSLLFLRFFLDKDEIKDIPGLSSP